MSRKNIAYKIVGKRNRMGTNMNICLEEKGISFTKFKKEYNKVWNDIKQYFPKYVKGEVINSVKGTVGIMCFQTKKSAQYFINDSWLNKSNLEIIKVLGCGKIRKRFKYIGGCGSEVSYLKKDPKTFDSVYNSDKSWIAYEQVVVLE
jgi:hypothetical protein